MRLKLAKIFSSPFGNGWMWRRWIAPSFLAVLARAFHRVVDRAVGRAPADEKDVAFLVAVNFRHRNFLGELLEFVAALRGHGHVQLRAAGGVAHLVVLEAGDERIFSVEHRRAGRRRAG